MYAIVLYYKIKGLQYWLIPSKRVRIVSKVSIRFLCEVASIVSDSATLCVVACQAPLSMGFPRQEYWSGLLFPSPEDLPDPGIEPISLESPALAGRFFTTEPSGKPIMNICCCSVTKLCLTLWPPWIAAHQASLSFTLSWSLLKFISNESVMLSNHLILFRSLLLLPSIFPSFRIFSNELALCIRWPKYWSLSLSFSNSPSNEYSGLISFRVDWFDLLGI